MRHRVLPLNATQGFALPSRGDMLAITPWFLFPTRGPLMPAPTPLPLRQAIRHRHRRGQTASAIAQALGLRPRTVRQLLRRWQQHADSGLAPAYRHDAPPRTPLRPPPPPTTGTTGPSPPPRTTRPGGPA